MMSISFSDRQCNVFSISALSRFLDKWFIVCIATPLMNDEINLNTNHRCTVFVKFQIFVRPQRLYWNDLVLRSVHRTRFFFFRLRVPLDFTRTFDEGIFQSHREILTTDFHVALFFSVFLFQISAKDAVNACDNVWKRKFRKFSAPFVESGKKGYKHEVRNHYKFRQWRCNVFHPSCKRI